MSAHRIDAALRSAGRGFQAVPYEIPNDGDANALLAPLQSFDGCTALILLVGRSDQWVPPDNDWFRTGYKKGDDPEKDQWKHGSHVIAIDTQGPCLVYDFNSAEGIESWSGLEPIDHGTTTWRPFSFWLRHVWSKFDCGSSPPLWVGAFVLKE